MTFDHSVAQQMEKIRREIQNPQNFQPNPESFSQAIIFSRGSIFIKNICFKNFEKS
jgi:hypothetical protein